MNNLHIVAFDIPYPPDYGGVIDIYHKVEALSKIGINIQLHCFEYGRKRSSKLEKICTSVHYYKRKTGFIKFLKLKPYITVTRCHKNLLSNLNKDNYPILFEGLHSCYFINHKLLKNRKKFVRSHNIEHEYYLKLAIAEKNPLRKLFFWAESLKLKFFEQSMREANAVFAISENDNKHLSKYGNSIFLPAFHKEIKLLPKAGRGQGIVYHGNLSVAENIKAALFLIKEVFSKIEKPVIIAGRKPVQAIYRAAENYRHITIIANPSQEEMNRIISEAQINILVTFQATGIKLKLLHALSIGRYCIANSSMTKNTGLEHLCLRADKPEAIIETINTVYENDFDKDLENYKKRKATFDKDFSNKKNAEIISRLLS